MTASAGTRQTESSQAAPDFFRSARRSARSRRHFSSSASTSVFRTPKTVLANLANRSNGVERLESELGFFGVGTLVDRFDELISFLRCCAGFRDYVFRVLLRKHRPITHRHDNFQVFVEVMRFVRVKVMKSFSPQPIDQRRTRNAHARLSAGPYEIGDGISNFGSLTCLNVVSIEKPRSRRNSSSSPDLANAPSRRSVASAVMWVSSAQESASVERFNTWHEPTYLPVPGSRVTNHGATPLIVIVFSMPAIVAVSRCRVWRRFPHSILQPEPPASQPPHHHFTFITLRRRRPHSSYSALDAGVLIRRLHTTISLDCTADGPTNTRSCANFPNEFAVIETLLTEGLDFKVLIYLDFCKHIHSSCF